MPNNKIVLAFSGGLDTSVAVPWLKEKYGADVITLTIDLGMVDLESIKERAMRVGASKALTVDGKEPLVQEFLYPALQAGAIYEEQYPLATALGRPLIARYMVEAARAEGAFAVAHGCTGKGNDQPAELVDGDPFSQKQNAEADQDERLGIVDSGCHADGCLGIGSEEHCPVDDDGNAPYGCNGQFLPGQVPAE